ncbi:glutathione S-transferase [Altererythrobacter aquiaggeris]|uniref:glutathione S-transferase family protein n=1 Tax=Aestuarierythrobacter aquiaggeris TaxID=1898396 RepID=UPI003016F552
MITLHHLEYSQSFRILWLLEELGAKYELKLYNRDPQSNLAPAEYKKISPLGTAPVITDGDLALAESNAIIDYILDQHPGSPLRPAADSPHRARHLFWFHASQGSLMANGGIEMIMRVLESRSPWPISKLLGAVFGQARKAFTGPRNAALIAKIESDLGTAPWFGGDQVTAADITMSYPMEALRDRGGLDAAHPNAMAWFGRVEALPSYKSARKIDDRPTVAFAI